MANLTRLSAMSEAVGKPEPPEGRPEMRPEGRPEKRVVIAIDRDRCMGSGNCQFWAPGTFDLDDDGIAVVVNPSGDAEEKQVLAAKGCPTQAIAVLRDGDPVDS